MFEAGPRVRDIHPGEESVETVDFLPLRDVGVVLCDALQGQLLHQVDLVGLLEVLVLGRERGPLQGAGGGRAGWRWKTMRKER